MPFHGGFGLLNLYGIPKPTYRAYQLLHRLGSEMLLVDGGHETVDAWAVRKGDRSITVLLTNHALPRHPIATQRVHVTSTHAPPVTSAFVERIDGAHANAKRAWKEMGEPEYPKGPEVERLQEVSRRHKES
ncbi:hypothetical protein BH20GEM1_BH20GEM1_09680 [soil metagenome]